MLRAFENIIAPYAVSGLYEEENRSLFYRKALGLRRFFENCDLPVYKGELLYPSGQVFMPHYMEGIAVDFEKLAEVDQAAATAKKIEFCGVRSHLPEEHCVAGNMFIHSMPNYERILKEGFSSYLPRIEKIADTDLRDGLVHLVTGIQTYLERCVAYLSSVGADEALVKALERVPMNPAETIYEAVVGWNFIMYLDRCDNLGCVASGLYPYYKGEHIVPLLENLFDNLDANNGYSMSLHTPYNPITLQCLEAIKGRRRPMIELFVDENTPEEIWEKAFAAIRTSCGQPAFYNPAVLLGGLQKKFPSITDEDIQKFCGGGCTESMLAGLSNVGSLDAGINLLLLLERTIRTSLAGAENFEAFYDAYIRTVEETVEQITEEISNSQRARTQTNPLPMRTLLIDDCIDKGLDYNNGGARYQWSIINFAGLINVIDAMLVIRDLIFVEKTMTAQEILCRLAENDLDFLAEARKHPTHYGDDNTQVNAFAQRLSEQIYAMLDDRKPFLGEGFLPASIQFMSQVVAGERVGATPDGREAGAPLCDSLGAIFGKDIKGPTALLNSVTALDLKRALGVPVLNFNINPDFKAPILKALILGYMKQGGIQMQITCISKEQLEEAYRNPENHRNLVVRVGGYSEYFCLLSDEMKRMVMDRTIQQELSS